MSIYIKDMKIPKEGVYTCELNVLDENTAVLTIYTTIDEPQRSYKLTPIEEAPTIEGAASPWHRVEDELPRGQELVIVAVKDTAGDTPFWYTTCGWITTDGEYWIVDNEICDYVVAWMPLPEPPKEEE